MLGKMIGNDIAGVNTADLPAIKFYTPKGVEPLPTRFLNEEVGGGIDDLRNVIKLRVSQRFFTRTSKTHIF